jgi:nucleoside 2-deoxyribosyltransferase
MAFSVYVAGPLTTGDLGNNLDSAINAANELLDAGFQVFLPHAMTLPMHKAQPRSYTKWMEFCFYWLLKCDAVLRLPGESKGADCETALARLAKIPVCASVAELQRVIELDEEAA